MDAVMIGRTIRRRAATPPALILLAAASLLLTSGPTFAPRPAAGSAPGDAEAAIKRSAGAGAPRPLAALVRRVPRLKAVRPGDDERWDRVARISARDLPLIPAAARVRAPRDACAVPARVAPPLRC